MRSVHSGAPPYRHNAGSRRRARDGDARPLKWARLRRHAEKAQRRQHALDRADQLSAGGAARRRSVRARAGDRPGVHDRHRIARHMAVVGQDLAVELPRQDGASRRAMPADGAAATSPHRQARHGSATGPRPAAFPALPSADSGPALPATEECPVEAQIGALQNDRGVLQPGDDALAVVFGSHAGRRMRAAMGRDPSDTKARALAAASSVLARACGAASGSRAAIVASLGLRHRAEGDRPRSRRDDRTAESGHGKFEGILAGRQCGGPTARSARARACAAVAPAIERPERRRGRACANTRGR